MSELTNFLKDAEKFAPVKLSQSESKNRIELIKEIYKEKKNNENI